MMSPQLKTVRPIRLERLWSILDGIIEPSPADLLPVLRLMADNFDLPARKAAELAEENAELRRRVRLEHRLEGDLAAMPALHRATNTSSADQAGHARVDGGDLFAAPDRSPQKPSSPVRSRKSRKEA